MRYALTAIVGFCAGALAMYLALLHIIAAAVDKAVTTTLDGLVEKAKRRQHPTHWGQR